ncbi:unnamed protein product [Linum tenue]|uniref:Amine oxidase domain-containing protein n=1 Tax=Linum tenue TaxID=586396 RepID=A0AAV0INS9_9ROSI|nr:unnamed protein product [Linum tenue]
MAAMSLISLFVTLLFSAAKAAQSPSVIVVGAGMSGISAAKTLYEAGIKDILILEASSRIGGRMLKADFSGYTVEMGANWYNSGGPVANPLVDLAKKVNLKSYINDYSNIAENTYKQEGGLYPKKDVEKVDEVATARDEYCSNFSKMLSRNKKKDVDVSILASQRLYGRPPLTPLEMVIDFYHNDYEDAEPPKVTSLKHTYPRAQFEEHGEYPHFVMDPRGFEVLVQYLASQILKKGSPVQLKLKKVAREIAYSKSGVTIKTEDGSTYSANYVIVSASVGVLQSDLIQFKPTLPVDTNLFQSFPFAELHFGCGEHNSNKFLGYVDGAYLEGIATANDLIKCIKGKGCKGDKNMEV